MNSSLGFRRVHRRVWRTGVALLAVALCAALVLPAALPARAQGGTGQTVAVGDVVTGTLDANNFVQIYRLRASAGDTITVDVTGDNAELGIVLLIVDEAGAIIASDVDLTSPTTASLAEINMPSNGTYYIQVMRDTGATGDVSGDYTMRVSGIQQVGGQTVTLENGGIVFDLVWDAAVDLNLEVRDPVGGTVQRFSPGSPSGGVLDADVNGNCDAAIATSPTETVAWPAGTVPAGSYEIIVYYTDACTVGGPQLFTLNATVDDDTTQSLIGTVNPGQEYLARMVLDPDGTWQLVNGGVNSGVNVDVFRTQIANAEPIAIGSTVSGVITNDSPAQAYTFTADAGTNIRADMLAQSGSLDTYLVLVNPDGRAVVTNDDAGETTDAGITYTTAVSGDYTLLATRYGAAIGGTEGEYTLTLTTPTSAEGETTGETPETAATPAAGEETTSVALPEGAIEVQLVWSTNADMQLLVRDPVGDAVYDDAPLIQSGGTLASAGNVGCENTTTAPVSYIYWPPGRLAPGTYEVEVWYQNTCDDPRPVNFGLTVTVQNQTVINLSQTASPDSRYIITFVVDTDGTVTAGPGGFFDMANPDSLNFEPSLSSATPIDYGQTVSGSITDQQRFQVYSFEGTQGDVVTIGMNAASGTLDPALYLLSPQQILVAYNDDVAPGENSNSAIEEVTLPVTGTYYILATHYGLDVGGTQGTYNLTIVQD